MQLTEYETTLVLTPDLTVDGIERSLERVRTAVGRGGKLLAINHWGRRKLAYEIAKHSRGIYVHTHYLGNGAVVSELERNLRISEDVLRYLTVKLADDVHPDSRDAHQYVAPTLEDAPEPVRTRTRHGDDDYEDERED
jgi:small subunit ribosomal protein S6